MCGKIICDICKFLYKYIQKGCGSTLKTGYPYGKEGDLVVESESSV